MHKLKTMKKTHLIFLLTSGIIVLVDIFFNVFTPETKRNLFWIYFVLSAFIIGYEKRGVRK
jgi:hypothetical protein